MANKTQNILVVKHKFVSEKLNYNIFNYSS